MNRLRFGINFLSDEDENIKKTMGHHALKGMVCDSPLFLGCSEIKAVILYPYPKGYGLISDIKDLKMINLLNLSHKTSC